MALDTAKLIEIEGLLSDDVLADGELIAELRDAGLVEVARVLNRALSR